MEKHEREVADYLRREYGVGDMWMQYGGRHAKLNFLFNGKRLKLPIGHLDEPRAMKNMQADLKRLLGPPPTPETRPTRTMEDLMSDLNASTATITAPSEAPAKPTTRTWAVQMAGYSTGKHPGSTVYLLFPEEAKRRFGLMKVERLDDENWKLSRGGHRQFYTYGAKVKITYHDAGVEPFGSVAAEAIETDGEILIYLAKDKRPPVSQIGVSVPFKAAPVPAPVPAQVSALTSPIMHGSTQMETEMRSIAKRVREIEAMCPYRFVRLETGKLLWRAPTIE